MRPAFIALLIVFMGLAFAQAASAASASEKVIYSFCSLSRCADGLGPSNLIAANGVLYGTSVSGGPPLSNRGCCGQVFSLDPATGTEKTIYYFCRKSQCRDGWRPTSLIYANGALYGTTMDGGTGFGGSQDGVAFALDPDTGAEQVLYFFCSKPNCPDGSHATSIMEAGGKFYGTTQTGGTGDFSPCPSCGTAYALDVNTGKETVLYSFCTAQNCTDGSNPNPAPLELNGVLYGTTVGGGTIGCGNGQACGTAYSLDPATGTHTVLHSFGAVGDGKYPESSLIAFNGLLYGTTYAGDVAGCGTFGCGTAYSLDPNTGTETVLHAFCSKQSCADGASPFAKLLEVNGTLYGTTDAGGAFNKGTVFALDPNTGAETVIYSFCSQANCTDGANPYSLLYTDGTFYGTTSNGGANGHGAIFTLKLKH